MIELILIGFAATLFLLVLIGKKLQKKAKKSKYEQDIEIIEEIMKERENQQGGRK